jgi:hypothetical protein
MEYNKFENSAIHEIKNHLELLGYSIDMTDSTNQNGGSMFLVFKHLNKPNIICQSSRNSENKVFLTSLMSLPRELSSIEQYKYLYTLESIISFSALYTEDEKNNILHIRSYYIGEYNKAKFGEFFDIFIREINYIKYDEVFNRLFIK